MTEFVDEQFLLGRRSKMPSDGLTLGDRSSMLFYAWAAASIGHFLASGFTVTKRLTDPIVRQASPAVNQVDLVFEVAYLCGDAILDVCYGSGEGSE